MESTGNDVPETFQWIKNGSSGLFKDSLNPFYPKTILKPITENELFEGNDLQHSRPSRRQKKRILRVF